MSEENADDVKPSVPKPDIPKPGIAATPPPPMPKVMVEQPKSSEPDQKSTDDDSVSDLDDTPASGVTFNARAIAYIIDSLIAGSIMVVAHIILPDILSSLGTIAGLAYIVTRDSLPFLNGQSIGKAVMKFKAVTLDGKSLTGDWKTGAIRNGALVVTPFAIVELIVLLSREDKPEQGKRLGDEWAKTKVIPVTPPAPQKESE